MGVKCLYRGAISVLAMGAIFRRQAYAPVGWSPRLAPCCDSTFKRTLPPSPTQAEAHVKRSVHLILTSTPTSSVVIMLFRSFLNSLYQLLVL